MKIDIAKLARKMTLKAYRLDMPYQNHRILRARTASFQNAVEQMTLCRQENAAILRDSGIFLLGFEKTATYFPF